MKTLLAAAAALVVAVPALRADDTSTKTIVEIAAGNKDFSTLVTAVKAAGLVDVLNGDGKFTVFAPTNKAFDKLGEETIKKVLADKETLTKILMAHVVKEKAVMASDVVQLKGEKVNGFTIEVEDGKVFLKNAKSRVQVVKTDIKAKNGVIHVIDAVMLPE
ncbi:MAG: fasciclin domain-containing protein [Gemmataceae bacterium]